MQNEDVITLLKKKMGDRTQLDFARELDISPQFLNDLLRGRRDPSDKILDYLGLKREIVKAK
jgi:hypothetical protein